jgi:hypothetical protein
MQDSLGKVTVPTPGSPVRATINRPNPDENFYVHGYVIQRLKDNKGDVYVSLSPTDDRDSLSRILGVLHSGQGSFGASISMEANGLNMADMYIDADNANDGVTIAILIS